jgi:choice-of-anchor C domain-containing protein
MKFSVLRNTLIAGVAAWGIATTAGAAAFTNGSFELSTAAANPGSAFTTLFGGSTAITGWTVGGDSIDYIGGYWQPEDGSRSVDLSGNANGSISQTFDTVAGQRYAINFFLAGNPDGGPAAKVAITSATGGPAQSDTFTVTGSDSHANMGWQAYTYNYTAASASTTLSFASATGTAYGPALDNVSVMGVPEPATWAMMLVGFGGLGAVLRHRRSAGALLTA